MSPSRIEPWKGSLYQRRMHTIQSSEIDLWGVVVEEYRHRSRATQQVEGLRSTGSFKSPFRDRKPGLTKRQAWKSGLLAAGPETQLSLYVFPQKNGRKVFHPHSISPRDEDMAYGWLIYHTESPSILARIMLIIVTFCIMLTVNGTLATIESRVTWSQKFFKFGCYKYISIISFPADILVLVNWFKTKWTQKPSLCSWSYWSDFIRAPLGLRSDSAIPRNASANWT